MPYEPDSDSARQPFELRGWHVLTMFIAFFGVVGSVNGIMLSSALRTMPGLDARNGYDPSQRYNAEIRAAESQAALGWRVTAHVEMKAGTALVTLELRDRDGRPMPAIQADVRLMHPSDRRKDVTVALQPRTDGRLYGDASGVNAGAWDLAIELRDPADAPSAPVFTSRQRLILKG